MLVPGSIPNIIFSKSFKKFSIDKWKYLYKNTFFISLIFFGLAIIFITNKIINSKSLLVELNDQFNFSIAPYLSLVFLLQFINWFLEALKFNTILKDHFSIKFKTVLKSVYAGNFTALITPERIGNFIGRFLVINGDKKLITLITILGNSFQLLITLLMCLIGLTYILLFKLDTLFTNNTQIIFILLIYSFGTFILTAVLFNLKWFSVFKNIKFLKKWQSKLTQLKNTSFKNKVLIFSYAFARYLVFILQYYVLVKVFNLSIDVFQLIVYLGLLFGIVTFIPSLIPGNLGTREALCILLFSRDVLGVKFALISLLVWIINVGFSSLIGGLILTFKRN